MGDSIAGKNGGKNPIVQLTRMGEGAQILPVLKLLKQQKPDSLVTLLCVKEFSGIFSRTSFFDRLVTIGAVDIARMRSGAAIGGLGDYPELLEPYDRLVSFTHNGIGGFFSGVVKAKSKSGQVHSELPLVKSDQAKYLFASQRCRVENLFNIVDMHSAMAGLVPEPVESYMRVDAKEIGETAPYGAGHAVLQAELPCSPCHLDQICDNPVCRDAIPVEAVEAAVENLLGYRADWGNGFSSLSVYVSGFTSGGSLLYAPAKPRQASERYIRGLVCRLLWGEALGFAKDERQTVFGLLGQCPPDALGRGLEEASERFSSYLNRYSLGARLLDRAAMVCAGPPSGFGQLNSICASLQDVETAVSSSEESIIKNYHMLKMGDLEYDGYAQLVRATSQVYGGLISTLESFNGTIDTLRSAHRQDIPTAGRKKTLKC